jgi:hypothetical protein
VVRVRLVAGDDGDLSGAAPNRSAGIGRRRSGRRRDDDGDSVKPIGRDKPTFVPLRT